LGGITTTEQAEIIANRIGLSLRQPFMLEGKDIHISASIGFALDYSHDLTPTELQARADIAMYQVKQNGRDNVLVYADHLSMNCPESSLAE
jgi:GGDEF domain-containing protein